jgi:hypothetical protein
MFISSFEKNRINSRIQSLEVCVDNLTKALSALSSTPTGGKESKPRKARTWSPEQRAVASERMKKRQAEAKAKVAA